MEIEKNNNKELVPLEHYLELYAKADSEEISSRTGIPFDRERGVFHLPFYGREYAVSFPKFAVSLEDGREGFAPLLAMNPAKTLAARFLLTGAAAKSTGKFLTYREIPWGEVYYRQFSDRCMARLAYGYGNRLEEFSRVMEHLGAEPVKAGDAGYEMEVFPGYYVRFLLWAGDEEFPPSSQILFSDNFPVGFHAEDLVVICDVLLGTMKKL